MDKPLTQLNDELKQATLTAEEKERIRTRLVSYMRLRPVSAVSTGEDVRPTDAAAMPIWSFVNIMRSFPMGTALRSMIIALLITAMAAGGVTWAAEGTLPGDALYPVKISVNERVRGYTAISPEAKTEWNVWIAERRLKEAEALAAEGRLETDASLKIEQVFAAHAATARERIKTIEEKRDVSAAADLSSRFEASLGAHARILASLAEEEDRDEDKTRIRLQIAPLLDSIRTEAKSFANARASAELKVATSTEAKIKASAEERRDAAKRKLKNAKSRIETKADLHARSSAQAQARLEAAAKLIAQGNTNLEAGAYGDAYVRFQQAIRMIQQLELIIDAANSLNITITAPTSAEIRINEVINMTDNEDEIRTHPDEDSADDDNKQDGSKTSVDAETNVRVETNTGGSVKGESSGSVNIDVKLGQ